MRSTLFRHTRYRNDLCVDRRHRHGCEPVGRDYEENVIPFCEIHDKKPAKSGEYCITEAYTGEGPHSEYNQKRLKGTVMTEEEWKAVGASKVWRCCQESNFVVVLDIDVP